MFNDSKNPSPNQNNETLKSPKKARREDYIYLSCGRMQMRDLDLPIVEKEIDILRQKIEVCLAKSGGQSQNDLKQDSGKNEIVIEYFYDSEEEACKAAHQNPSRPFV